MDAGRVNCTTDQVGAKLVTFPPETVVKVFVTREPGCLAPTNQLASRPIRLGDKSTILNCRLCCWPTSSPSGEEQTDPAADGPSKQPG